MLKKSFLFAAAMGIVLGAGAATLRVELSGGNKVELLPVEAPETIELRPMNWLKPSEQKFTLWGVEKKAATSEWQTATFEFTPKSNGLVMMFFRGEQGDLWVTNLASGNNLVANGDMTSLDPEKTDLPQGYYFRGTSIYSKTGGEDGSAMVRVGANGMLIRQLWFPGNKPCRITISYKEAK